MFFTETRSSVVTQAVSCPFSDVMGAFNQNIQKHYNQCNNYGSVLERKCHRPSSVRSPENIDAVRAELQRSPCNIKEGCTQLLISRQSVQQILKSYLSLYPYKMTVLQKLTVQNKQKRMAFAEWDQNNEVSFNNVRFCDEAHFTWMVWLINQNMQESTCDS
jgi:hypothetical protein